MATDPKARLRTLFYTKGSVRATNGALEKLFGAVPSSWTPSSATEDGPRKRPYGYRRKANAAAGEPLTLVFADGQRWTYRVTGTHKRFISVVLANQGANVVAIESQRGAIYGASGDLTSGSV